MRKLLALAVIMTAAIPAFAYRVPPFANETYKTQCSDCHMAFQPQLLPVRSWRLLLGDLSHHFGEDASIDPRAVTEIRAYLMQNAGDSTGRNRGLTKRLPPDETPLRITELPLWVAIHSDEVPQQRWKRAGSKANCAACHTNAAEGYYREE